MGHGLNQIASSQSHTRLKVPAWRSVRMLRRGLGLQASADNFGEFACGNGPLRHA